MAGKKMELDRRQREQVERIVRAAWEGKLKWVDEIIRQAGYVRGDAVASAADRLLMAKAQREEIALERDRRRERERLGTGTD